MRLSQRWTNVLRWLRNGVGGGREQGRHLLWPWFRSGQSEPGGQRLWGMRESHKGWQEGRLDRGSAFSQSAVFTGVPGRCVSTRSARSPSTLSGCSQNRPPYCTFSGLGDCPNKIILPFPSPEEVPTLMYEGIPRTLRSALLDEPIVVGRVCL